MSTSDDTTVFAVEITANFGGDIGETTGRFEAFTNPTDTDEVRTGYLLDDTANQMLSLLTDLVDEGESDRKGFHLDLGGGQHAVGIRADVTSDATSGPAGPLQWGSSADPDVFDATTATGGTALQKTQIFQHYCRVGGADSLTPARLEFGEYSEDGVLDPLDVVFEQPKFERKGPDKHQFSCTFLETATLGESYDGSKQTDG